VWQRDYKDEAGDGQEQEVTAKVGRSSKTVNMSQEEVMPLLTLMRTDQRKIFQIAK